MPIWDGRQSMRLSCSHRWKTYFVDGTSIDSHGDAHAADGFLYKENQGVTGTVVNDRFVATSFELLPEQEIEHKSNVFNSSKYCQTHCTKSRRRSLFLSQLETHRFKAKTILLRRTICKYSYFTNSGILRVSI
jgi:hypothetical protein